MAERPYPRILGDELGIPVFNFGIGGARPATYLDCAPLLDALKQCRFAIVELMSARSYRSSLFTPLNANSGIGRIARDDLNIRPYANDRYFIDHVYSAAVRQIKDPKLLIKISAEVRSAYIADMKELGSLIGRKSILLYFSQRQPSYAQSTSHYDGWSGGFPHFVDRKVIELCADRFSHFEEYVSRVGLPAPVRAKHSGQFVEVFPSSPTPTMNSYYPSQEMHSELAARLKTLVLPRLASMA